MGIHQRSSFGRPILSDIYLLGELRGRSFQVRSKRQSGKIVGKIQAQRENELREIQPSYAILL